MMEENNQTSVKQPAQKPEYDVVNAYEDEVKYNVKQLMRQMDMCMCDKCLADTCAIVFNNGYAKFVTTKRGGALAKLTAISPNEHVQLMVAITEALKKVKESPMHDKD